MNKDRTAENNDLNRCNGPMRDKVVRPFQIRLQRPL